MEAVLTCIHVGRGLPLLNPSYHSAAGPRRRDDEKSAFFLNRNLAASSAAFGGDPSDVYLVFDCQKKRFNILVWVVPRELVQS